MFGLRASSASPAGAARAGALANSCALLALRWARARELERLQALRSARCSTCGPAPPAGTWGWPSVTLTAARVRARGDSARHCNPFDGHRLAPAPGTTYATAKNHEPEQHRNTPQQRTALPIRQRSKARRVADGRFVRGAAAFAAARACPARRACGSPPPSSTGRFNCTLTIWNEGACRPSTVASSLRAAADHTGAPISEPRANTIQSRRFSSKKSAARSFPVRGARQATGERSSGRPWRGDNGAEQRVITPRWVVRHGFASLVFREARGQDGGTAARAESSRRPQAKGQRRGLPGDGRSPLGDTAPTAGGPPAAARHRTSARRRLLMTPHWHHRSPESTFPFYTRCPGLFSARRDDPRDPSSHLMALVPTAAPTPNCCGDPPRARFTWGPRRGQRAVRAVPAQDLPMVLPGGARPRHRARPGQDALLSACGDSPGSTSARSSRRGCSRSCATAA